jgi:Zn-dependent peptidase ImmA (M78 family)
MGIRLARAQLDSARAVWAREGKEYVVYCGRYERPASVSFTLFHELFEILSHHPRFPSALSYWLEQRLANRFAAALLMPEEAVRREASRFGTNPECLVPILAEKFGVSRSAMGKRLYELGLERGRLRRARGRSC